MGLFGILQRWMGGSVTEEGNFGDASGVSSDDLAEINPATGLPMIDGIGGVDVAGNPYGVNLHSADPSCSTIDLFPDPLCQNDIFGDSSSADDVFADPIGHDSAFDDACGVDDPFGDPFCNDSMFDDS